MAWEIWKGEFDYLYDRIGQGLMTITMHPQVIGRGHRMLFLEQFIDYVAGHAGASFTRLGDYQKRMESRPHAGIAEARRDRARLRKSEA